MKKYYLSTFGCQMNVHDSERIAGILKSEDYVETDSPRDADIVIFNTCSIRQKAEQKFYSELGRVKSLKRKNPGLKIAVAGCIAQQEGSTMLRRAGYIDHVIGPQNIHVLRNILNSKADQVAVEDNPLITEMELPADRKDTVRAWVNIMYGCNNFCSYCIVPYTRGRERSRAAESILDEVKGLAQKGYKEATLLGQNVNSFRSSMDFPGLLREMDRIEGLERIRFVTSHPKDLSDELIYAMRDLGKVCEHIHLPLQSGSTRILGLMNRRYTYDEYLEKVVKLRKEVPGIAITSDIIAGFPGETEEDHACTIAALGEIGYDGIFAFKYSPRKGTRAADMDGHLTDEVKSQRLSAILALQDAVTERKNKELEGTFQEILVEGESEKDRSKLCGRTRTNKIVNIRFDKSLSTGDILSVKITRANKHSLEGDIVPE
ncbi:MAG TPA: tRNA (N6-isopentenyl adenosine(37)-C2)-methylthiotransferase MiaB [Dissulfurispiraceae bacterium]